MNCLITLLHRLLWFSPSVAYVARSLGLIDIQIFQGFDGITIPKGRGSHLGRTSGNGIKVLGLFSVDISHTRSLENMCLGCCYSHRLLLSFQSINSKGLWKHILKCSWYRTFEEEEASVLWMLNLLSFKNTNLPAELPWQPFLTCV